MRRPGDMLFTLKVSKLVAFISANACIILSHKDERQLLDFNLSKLSSLLT